MKRTEYIVMVSSGVGSGTEVYRRVFTDGKSYFIKWNGKVIEEKIGGDCHAFIHWEGAIRNT